jgi:hypothetical protein
LPCYLDYIGLDRTSDSRSGLYAVDLPGVEIALLEGLQKPEQLDYLETWEMIQKNAWNNLIADLTERLQDKFIIDLKLLSRETSQFKEDANGATGLAGVLIGFNLPKYAKIHIISVDAYSEVEYDSPEATIEFYDEEGGTLLHSVSSEITIGKNTINVDRDFEENQIFIAFNPESNSFRSTENKKYLSPYISWSCDECSWDCGQYRGTVKQINGGGLNVKYVVFCSIEKFLCENINLFRSAYYWAIGIALIHERRYGNRLNRFMTMIIERAEELTDFYKTEYEKYLNSAVKNQNIEEDPYCFSCRRIVSKRTSLP